MHTRRVTKERDIGLIGILIVLLHWPDSTYAGQLIAGFPAVGYAEWCGVYPQKPARRITLDEVLEKGTELLGPYSQKMGPGANDEYIAEASLKDYERGWSSPPLTWDALRKQTRGRPINLIRRFAIDQPSGKKRIIDDAAEGGQSETSEDANKVQFCNATQPAKHVAALTEAAKECKLPGMENRPLESGGEDWPDAYRGTPMNPAHAEACVVVYWHPGWNEAAFQIYHSMLFGLPLAVTGFNRYPKICQAIVRRFLFILFSMYFDDATIQDWAAAKGSGQKEVRKLMKILGTPFAPCKQQDMAVTGDFLGLVHDLTHATSSGLVKFWVREKSDSQAAGYDQNRQGHPPGHPGGSFEILRHSQFLRMWHVRKNRQGRPQRSQGKAVCTNTVLTEHIDRGVQAHRSRNKAETGQMHFRDAAGGFSGSQEPPTQPTTTAEAREASC